jgi:ABC-type dipeptide/oligopeptide/nickel transport system ATPase component/ABC-type dipeptide/oligopeptide/nickel transport system permease component
MRATPGSRWLVVLVVWALAGHGVLLLAGLVGSGPALLQPLSARLPLAAAGTVAAPPLTVLLGMAGGLLAARRTEWIDRRLRALVLTGCAACLGWMVLVTGFWFLVRGELLALHTLSPAERAGASALSTLLLPATAVVFGAAWLIARRVRTATRSVALAAHVRTAHSWGLPTTGRILRQVLRGTLPAILIVSVVEFLVLYAGSLTVQAVFVTPALAATLPLLPAESLATVMILTLSGIIALSLSALPIAALAFGPPTSPLRPSPPATPEPGAPILPSTSFRSSDVLDIRDLRLQPGPGNDSPEPRAGISLTVARGQTLAVIGDHGDYASLLCHAIVGLPPLHSAVSSGSILFDGTELVGLPERHFRALRGQRIGFLDAPGTSRLDPDARIGRQLAGLVAGRQRCSRSRARSAVLAALTGVGIEDAAAVFEAYPHQLSDATAQRVLLAGALARNPELLVADHPTLSLAGGDEEGFLDVLHALQEERGFTLIVASSRVENVLRCDRVAVMDHGAIVEYASPHDLVPASPRPQSRQVSGAERSARSR